MANQDDFSDSYDEPFIEAEKIHWRKQKEKLIEGSLKFPFFYYLF